METDSRWHHGRQNADALMRPPTPTHETNTHTKQAVTVDLQTLCPWISYRANRSGTVTDRTEALRGYKLSLSLSSLSSLSLFLRLPVSLSLSLPLALLCFNRNKKFSMQWPQMDGWLGWAPQESHAIPMWDEVLLKLTKSHLGFNHLSAKNVQMSCKKVLRNTNQMISSLCENRGITACTGQYSCDLLFTFTTCVQALHEKPMYSAVV